MKSHIMPIVTSVHLKVVRCHQFKKRHHMRLLLKVFADLECLFLEVEMSTKGSLPLTKGEHSTDPAVVVVSCGIQ